MTDLKYRRAEKLKYKRETDLLFKKGSWKTCGPLRIVSLNLDKKPQEGLNLSRPKVGVSTPKRNFKKAVDRNRIKRLLRETYRLNKELFAGRFGNNSLAMIFWVSQDMPRGLQEVQESFENLCSGKK